LHSHIGKAFNLLKLTNYLEEEEEEMTDNMQVEPTFESQNELILLSA